MQKIKNYNQKSLSCNQKIINSLKKIKIITFTRILVNFIDEFQIDIFA